MLRFSLFCLALVVASGCDSSTPSGTSDPNLYNVTPLIGAYAGSRTITTDGTPEVQNITFTVTVDRPKRKIKMSLQPPTGSAEIIDGTYDDNSIDVNSSRSGASIRFSVGTDGQLSGTYTAGSVPGAITGQLTASRFDLTFAPTTASQGARTEIRTTR